MFIGMITAVALNSRVFGQKIYSVCTAAQSNFSERGQIFHCEKSRNRSLRLNLGINLSALQALYKILRLDIHQLNLIGIVKNGIGNSLSDSYARY